MSLLKRYRATGADLPFGDPLRSHGVAMEGYFLRLTDVERERVAIALIGVNKGPSGPWATLGLASQVRGGPATLALREAPEAWADPRRIGATSGSAFSYGERHLRVDLGPGARLEVDLTDHAPWPRRSFGGSSVFQTVPALNQYWHPWLLGGRATGWADFDGERWDFDGAAVYGEKNWGAEGFPEAWWWGQAQGFDDPTVCVAFAGGRVHSGPLEVEVTALVVRLPGGRVVRLGDPVVSPVRATVSDDVWEYEGRGYGWRIRLRGTAPLADAHVLPVPLPSEGRNTAGDLEHLCGDLEVEVSRWGKPVWSGRTRLAALEHGGLDRAEAELRRRGLPPGTTGAAP